MRNHTGSLFVVFIVVIVLALLIVIASPLTNYTSNETDYDYMIWRKVNQISSIVANQSISTTTITNTTTINNTITTTDTITSTETITETTTSTTTITNGTNGSCSCNVLFNLYDGSNQYTVSDKTVWFGKFVLNNILVSKTAYIYNNSLVQVIGYFKYSTTTEDYNITITLNTTSYQVKYVSRTIYGLGSTKVWIWIYRIYVDPGVYVVSAKVIKAYPTDELFSAFNIINIIYPDQ